MNFSFPLVFIPDDIRWLYDMHLNNSKQSYNMISEEILKRPFLRLHINKIFKKYMRGNSIDSFINTIGWKGFRDRLASSYLFHAEFGFFPDIEMEDKVKDIVEFENKLNSIFPEGSNRIFILGIFLKLCDISNQKENQDDWSTLLEIDTKLLEVINLGDQKVLKPDWLIFTLILFNKYFSSTILKEELIKHKGHFLSLFSLLKDDQKINLMQNLLRYGASIDEEEMFLFEKV